MIYAIIDSAGFVVNTVLWDGISTWTPPENCIAVEIPEGSGACIGWIYIDGEFVPPPIDPPA